MTLQNRREFVGALIAAPALAQAAPRKVTVAAHPWVYAATQPGYDIYPILDRIFADVNYARADAIELMHTALRPNDAVERIAELSRKFRVPVLGMSFEGRMWDRAAHSAVLDEANLLIPRLAKLGGRTLGTSVGDARRKKTPDELDAQAECLRKVIGIADKYGVTLNLHNHIYEVAGGEYDLSGTLSRIPGIRLGPDLDWLKGAGVDPLDFIRRRGRLIVFAHLRDRKADGVWSEAMGEGAIDYAAIGRELHRINFQGDLAIELAHPANFRLTRPLRDSLKISREYVRRVMGY